MHPLLTRQIKRYLGGNERLNLELQCFINAVEQSYRQFDEEAQFNERALELVSVELNERNSRLRNRSAEQACSRADCELLEQVRAGLQHLEHGLAAPVSSERDQALRAALATLQNVVGRPPE